MSRFQTDGAGKGDSYRDVDSKKYSENYDRIFGKKPLNIMKEEEHEKTEETEDKSCMGLQPCDENQTK